MITIVGTNDFHSALSPGLGTLAALLRWKAAGAILLDAGDFFAGSSFHEFAGGRPAASVLSSLFDAIVPGNHDLADLTRNPPFDEMPIVVCSNLNPPSSFPSTWVSSLLLRRGDVGVGVVGFIGEQSFFAVPPTEREGFAFTPPSFESLADRCNLLRTNGADVVVGISHTGFQSDVRLQQEHALFDVLLSSHCHSKDYVWADEHGRRLVIKAPECGQGLSRIRLDRLGPREACVEWPLPDTDAQTQCFSMWPWLKQCLSDFDVWQQELIGHLDGDHPVTRMELTIRIADAALLETDADVVILNVGAVRHGLPATVCRGDLADALPFDSDFVRGSLPAPVDDLVNRSRDLGEDVIVRPVKKDSASFATTRYVAHRLGLPYMEITPPLTLRTISSKLLRGATI